jgi:hypothetical protein
VPRPRLHLIRFHALLAPHSLLPTTTLRSDCFRASKRGATNVADGSEGCRATGALAKPATAISSNGKVRFVADGLKSQRSRLGLSAADYGRLVGVSAQSVYNWNKSTRVLVPSNSR